MTYQDFIAAKTHQGADHGFDPTWMPDILFPFQRALVEWSVRKGRAAIFADCGLGKTFCQLTWAENVARKTGGRVLILTPLAVAFQTVNEGIKCGVEVEHRREGIEAGDRIVVTNYERLHHFNADDFAGVVCDECFAPDTLVECFQDGACKAKEIRHIRPGETIINASGIDTVRECHRRKVTRAYAVSFAGRRIIASENHPWLTQRGWVPSRALRQTDRLLETAEAMRMVRENVCAEDGANGQRQILREVLLSEMAHESARNCGEGAYEGSARTDWEEGSEMVGNDGSRKGEGTSVCGNQAYALCGNAGEGEPHIESDEAQTFRAWRKREGFDCTAIASLGGATEWMGERVCLVTWSKGSRLSDMLQTGPCESRNEDCNRSGRSESLQPKGAGCKEGCETGFIRLDGIEALERGHPDLERFANSEGDIYFYDIGLTRHPSFTVNGALVHNSSILKNFEGATRAAVTDFMRKRPYRLLCTATAAPNDYVELGTSSEAIGDLGMRDMVTRFFKQDDGARQGSRFAGPSDGRVDVGGFGKYRLRPHATHDFWRWVCSWARAMRRPSDMGFEDGEFALPPLNVRSHCVRASTPRPGYLFDLPAVGLAEQRTDLRHTITERCEMVAALVNAHKRPACVWCNLIEEGHRLSKLIPDAVEVSGSDSEEFKEESFSAFINGQIRVLVTKPTIAGFGLNFQHCADTTYFPSHSYEQYYQSVRRFWRFGQKRAVTVDMITTDGQEDVVRNLNRKTKQADEMFERLTAMMWKEMRIERQNTMTQKARMPIW